MFEVRFRDAEGEQRRGLILNAVRRKFIRSNPCGDVQPPRLGPDVGRKARRTRAEVLRIEFTNDTQNATEGPTSISTTRRCSVAVR